MMWKLRAIILLVTISLGYTAFATNSHISLSIDNIHSPVFSAKEIKVNLIAQQLPELEVHIAEIVVQKNVWRNIKLFCSKFQFSEKVIACSRGKIHLPHSAPLAISFRFIPNSRNLKIEVQPSAEEDWQFSLFWNENDWRSAVAITNGQVGRIAHWLFDAGTIPIPSKGEINGYIDLTGNADGDIHVVADLSIDQVAFSDQRGLHAGENVSVALNLDATHSSYNKEWRWQSEVNWSGGEIFWQPLYLSGGGYNLNLSGALNGKNINLSKGKIILRDIGELDFSGTLSRSDYELVDFDLRATGLELTTLLDQILKPFLSDTVLAEMTAVGHSSLVWRYRNGVTQSLVLDLHDVSLADQRERFALYRMNVHLPWKKNNPTIADVSFLSGHILRVPLGALRVPLEMNQFELRIPQLVLPILDGKLKIENFVALQQDNNWRWQFHGELLPVSMEQLTRALQIQQMYGTISGFIPKISYVDSVVTVDGTLLFDIFDGTVTAKNLKLSEPMGLVPRLAMDLAMKDLDLELLTRTFSFGNMQGRIDIEMQDLELASWWPVKFDAKLSSSAGSYPRRISQAAIQNISALGGESAVAAIQRSLLRFFKEFSYSEIGWQCLLRNNVCYMGGIESSALLEELESEGYVIVKGGGIPAITVTGYNRNVSWRELVNRLKRVVQGDDPVIQ